MTGRPFDREVLRYIQQVAESSEPRRRSARLPVRMTGGWRGAEDSGYSVCTITDISREGMGVEFYGDAEGVEKGAVLGFRVLLPEEMRSVEFEGEVRWVFRPERRRGCVAGVSFRDVPAADRLALLGHAWNRVQRRRLRMLVWWGVGAVLALSLLFAAGYAAVAQRTAMRLAVSESERQRLESVLERLAAELEAKRRAVASNSRVLSGQKETIREQTALLRRQEEELRTKARNLEELEAEASIRAEELLKKKAEVAKLEEAVTEKERHLRSLERMVDEIGREWDLETGELRLVVLDSRYEELRQAFERGDSKRAVELVEDLQRRFPKAKWLYKLAYRAYRAAGMPEKAEKVFREYMAVTKEELDRVQRRGP